MTITTINTGKGWIQYSQDLGTGTEWYARTGVMPAAPYFFKPMSLMFSSLIPLPTAQGQLSELRYGIWGYCWYEASGARTCSPVGHAYSTTVYNADKSSWQTVGPSWTRGLAVHPAAAGLTFFALLFSLSTHVFFTLLASLTSFLAALLTLVAFALDIALLAFVRRQMARLTGVSEHTDPGAAFWMTLISFVLLCLAGSTVCVGRRRDRMASMNSKMNASWRDRFRRQA